MPYLNVGNDWSIFDPFEVMGVMFFPQDENKREQFLTIMRSKTYVELVENDQKIILDQNTKDLLITDLKNMVKELINTPSYEHLLNVIDVESIGGHLAGDVLIYLHQMIDAGNIKEPSIHKAKAIVVTKYGQGKLFNGSKISLKKDQNSLWTKFKPVAHLWAAWHECTGDSRVELTNALADCDNHPFFGNFPGFLAMAEYFRRFGEATKTPRGHKGRQAFVLDPQETWQVPDSYPLPAISPTHSVGLDEWAIKTLKDEFPGSVT